MKSGVVSLLLEKLQTVNNTNGNDEATEHNHVVYR